MEKNSKIKTNVTAVFAALAVSVFTISATVTPVASVAAQGMAA